jgi:hypothetical protein
MLRPVAESMIKTASSKIREVKGISGLVVSSSVWMESVFDAAAFSRRVTLNHM